MNKYAEIMQFFSNFAFRRGSKIEKMNKQKLQEREFLALKDKHRVILKWATGCGKSKMVIDLINHAVGTIPTNDPTKVLFVVAERAHINNWQDEFDKWGLKTDKISTYICCYASLKKYVDYCFWDIVVLDEAHHCFTEKRMAALEELKEHVYPLTGRIYLLSATLSPGKQDMIEDIFGKFKTSTVSLKDAIEGDILPDPKVYVIELTLDNTLRHQEIKIGNNPKAPVIRWEDRGKYIYKNVPCIIQCTEYQKNQYLTEKIEYWKRRYELTRSEYMHNLWVNTGSMRKRFLGELKTGVVRQLLGVLKNKRYVCFCASVAQAESLSSSNTISSKRPDKLNQRIIDAFNNKQLNNIFAVGMITEGMNLNDIQAGIITQLDGKERLFIQKFGRSLRAEDPVSFIFYYKDTQDENYLKGALENIDPKYIHRISLNQLNSIKL